MIKVGVVGLGVMGQNHIRVYSELDCQIVWAVDNDPVKCEQVSNKFNVKCYPDYFDLINSIDAVSITVPTSLHGKIARDFLLRGIDCLIEKPIASTVEEAQELTEIAKRHDAKLMIGHVERFNPVISKLKQLVDSNVLGQLVAVSTRRVGPFVPRIRDVGIIIDTATHDIDIIRYLIGKEPLSVSAVAGNFKHQREDFATILMGFGDALGSVEVNWFTPQKERTLIATGSEGICYLDYINQTLELANTQGREKVFIDKTEPLKAELTHFLECVKNGIAPSVDGECGTKVLEIAMKALRQITLKTLI